MENSVKTVQEANDLSSEIDALLESIFKTQERSLDDSLREVRVKTAQNLKEIFLKNKVDVTDREAVKEALEKLKEELEKLRIIRLTIAFEPSYETIANIYKWVSSALGEGYILDISTDVNILGGAIVVFNGEYRDLTLRKSLAEAFKAKKEEILKFRTFG